MNSISVTKIEQSWIKRNGLKLKQIQIVFCKWGACIIFPSTLLGLTTTPHHILMRLLKILWYLQIMNLTSEQKLVHKAAKYSLLMVTASIDMVDVDGKSLSYVMLTNLWGKFQCRFQFRWMITQLMINYSMNFFRCKARCVLDLDDGRLQFTSLVHSHDIGKFRGKSSTKQRKKNSEKTV